MMRLRPIGTRAAGVAAVPAKYERGGRGRSGAGGRASSSCRRAEPAPPPPEGSSSRLQGDARGAGERRAGRQGSGRRSVRARAEGKGGRGERPVPAEAPLGGRRPFGFWRAGRSVLGVVRVVPRKRLATRMAPFLTLLLQPRPFFSCAFALSLFFPGPLW